MRAPNSPLEVQRSAVRPETSIQPGRPTLETLDEATSRIRRAHLCPPRALKACSE